MNCTFKDCKYNKGYCVCELTLIFNFDNSINKIIKCSGYTK